ncbi:MAG: DUF1282 domain-containing protein [Gammaproteobacteria bacterium]|nr:MAG: DUF1282 domain-containing protein [Gammaproteobacteria bacterium]
MIHHAFGLIFQPRKQWRAIAAQSDSQLALNLAYPILLAIIPSVAWYYGTTQVGWSIGDGDTLKLTHGSALGIAVAMYVCVLGALTGIGYLVHWMSVTYGAQSSLVKGVALSGFTATPFFIAGVVGFYPNFTIDLLVSFVAIAHGVYLLYTGIPIMMKVPEDRGFLFASAVLGVAMVMFMVLMGVTVILWDAGLTPVFTD